MDAAAIARKQRGSFMGEVMKPTQGYRDALARRGGQPKDHAKENLRMIRDAQRVNRERREAEEGEQAPQPFKLRQFEGVESRVEQKMQECMASAEPHKEFLLRKSESGPPKLPGKPFVSKRAPISKPPVPRAAELLDAPVPERPDRNFLRENKHDAVRGRATTPDPAAAPASRETKLGEVPQYLQDRKAQWAAEEARQRAEAQARTGCPPGMVLMPEAERLETLRALRETEADVRKQMLRLPLVIETMGQVRRQRDLEAKLQEVEGAIKTFDRPKVFVRKEA